MQAENRVFNKNEVLTGIYLTNHCLDILKGRWQSRAEDKIHTLDKPFLAFCHSVAISLICDPFKGLL
ncbi:MAG: hypothetical protein LC117_00850 [Bacteroidia bacterium]|nr:hypothetical protein [Bacteroidia bacterium]MCZ2276466.1 hypothetical protein [Bacteroidia bacterium]